MNSWWDKGILLKRKRKRLSSLRGSHKKMAEENKGSKSGRKMISMNMKLCIKLASKQI